MYNVLSYLKFKGEKFLYNLKNEENGGAELIATIVIIGIVLVLAFIFRDQISGLVANLWNSIVQGNNSDGSQQDIVSAWGAGSSN